MKTSLFVISDLHLGGAPAHDGRPSFQMCSAEGRTRLTHFIGYVAAQKSAANDVHLVLNGDIVDFLAEQQFASFTCRDDLAREKLVQIIQNSPEVWESLNGLVTSGVRLTMLLGNHDAELSLPQTKKLLLKTVGSGRVEFIYDNEALVEGDVLIEHGNRYDRWNVLSYDVLRAIRSALSRKEPLPIEYLGPAGSQLVHRVMNPIKAQFPFVDLLKPEGPGMLPILAVLDPAAMKAVPKLAVLADKSARIRFDKSGIPVDLQNIAAPVSTATAKRDRDLIALAHELAGEDASNISALSLSNLWERLKKATTDAARKAESKLLLRALRAFAEHQAGFFDVNQETEDYRKPAVAAVERGFRVVIFGHTHLVKRVSLDQQGARYLNTGTWADLMKIPDAIVRSGDDDTALRQLAGFLVDLEKGNLSKWRVQVPTFARVEFDEGEMRSADVYFFDGPDKVERVPDGRLTRLEIAATA